jgi:transcriptional regulator with XRE-family HTH domain
METIELIEKAIEARGWSWADLSRATGIRKARFSLWKKPQGEPSFSEVIAICDALDFSLDELRRLDDQPAPPARTEEAKILLDTVFGGDNPIGLTEALRRLANRPHDGIFRLAQNETPRDPHKGVRVLRGVKTTPKRGRPSKRKANE